MVAIGRIAKSVSNLLFNPKFQDTVTTTLRASKKTMGFSNIHKQIGDAFVKANNVTKGSSIWTDMWQSVRTLPSDIGSTYKASKGIWGTTKGIFSQIGKRMPVIGAGLMVAFELPNIFSAFKDKGLVGGVLETGKSTARLCGFMSGMAIGQALIPIPIIGGLIGGIAGDWLVSKVVGKSHMQKKAEMEEAVAQADTNAAAAQQMLMQQQMMANPYASNPFMYAQNSIAQCQPTMTPQQIMMLQQMLYSGGATDPMNQDFMAMTSGMNRLNYLG